jgi:hypothetical protein
MFGNRGFVAAWLAGMSIVIWRDVHKSHRVPVPGTLLGISALFAGLALAADVVPRAAPVITLTAWGLDIAALFSALPAGLGGQLNQAADVSHSAEAGGGRAAQAPATTGG